MSTCKKSPTGEHDWELSEGSMMFCNNDCFGTPGGDDTVMDEYGIVGYIKELEDTIKTLHNPWIRAEGCFPVSPEPTIGERYQILLMNGKTAFVTYAKGHDGLIGFYSLLEDDDVLYNDFQIAYYRNAVLPAPPVTLNYETTNDDIGRTNELFPTPSEDMDG